MQPSALAQCISLHRVRLPVSVGGRSGDCGDNSLPHVALEPLVTLTGGGGKGGSGGENHGVVEESPSLRVLLEHFCTPLLMKRMSLVAECHVTSRHELYSVGATSTVAEEGIFIQVPSRKFTLLCLRSAGGGGATMDVIYYNSLSSRCQELGDDSRNVSSPGGGTVDDNKDMDDEGYLYGFAFFFGVGHTREGLLLSAFSFSPLFEVLRTVVLETVLHIVRALRDIHVDRCTLWQAEELEAVSSVCTYVMSPLADLVDVRSAACSTPANKGFFLSFPQKKISVVRPDDFHYPFINVPLAALFLSFSYDAIRVIHSLLLQERRMVFIGATPQHASACVVSVQALLSPLLWTLPILPYVPPAACELVEALGSSAFVVGSTSEVVPRLMLYSGFSTADRDRVWFADCRTGMIGVSPPNAISLPFTMVELVPHSDKVKDSMKQIVSKEMRQLFRAALSSAPVQSLGSAHRLSSTLAPCTNPANVEEVYGAFLEYSVARLVGNYRKGLLPANSRSGSANNGVTGSSQLQGKVMYTLDYTRFLPSNLDNNVTLARCIAETKMFHHWEYMILSLETLGVMRSLHGEFLRTRIGSLQGAATTTSTSSLQGRESLAAHYYLSNPRMVGLLRLFFMRSARRFPELYADLQGSDLVRLSEGTTKVDPRMGDGTTASSTSFAAGGGGTGNSSSDSSGGRKGGKKLMHALFSRATKAMKNTLVSHSNRIPVLVFVQAYGSFANKTNYEKDSNKQAAMAKALKNNTTTAALMPPPQSQNYTAMPMSPSSTATSDIDDDVFGATSKMFDVSSEDSDTLRRVTTGLNENASLVYCRHLPLDIIHQFDHYHMLLDPTKDSVYTTGKRGNTTAMSTTTRDLKRLVDLGQLFAADMSIWSRIESWREDMRMMEQPPCIHLSVPSSKEPQQEPVQQSFVFHTGDNNGTNYAGVPFEAQPLPFSMDLVTGTVELPPVSDNFVFPGQSGNPTSTTTTTTRSALEQQKCQENESNSGNILDHLFAFATPQPQLSPAPTNATKQLEDLFQ